MSSAVLKRTFALTVMVLLPLLIGCAGLLRSVGSGSAGQLEDAHVLARQGKYDDAHTLCLKIAEAQPGTDAAEEALYTAALLSVSSRNPDRDYVRADREFDALLHQFPTGRHIDDASAWLLALEAINQARVNSLVEQIEALTKKLADADAARQLAEAAHEVLRSEFAAVSGERDELIAEQEELGAGIAVLQDRITALLSEKDSALREKTALARERDGLVEDKAKSEKTIEALATDKRILLSAKALLEKRIAELSRIDVKMEKKRKTVKQNGG